MSDRPTLKRSLTLPLITLYGVGTIVGAGIFVLIGEVAGQAGMFAPVAFALATLLVAFTAFSFAELASRFPVSAGEAVYVHQGFGRRAVSLTVGLLVALAGIVSCATIANGFVGYFNEFVAAPAWLVVALVVLGLGLVAAWGISESVGLAAAVTVVEVGALVALVWAGRGALAELPARLGELAPPADGGVWLGIVGGAVIAFYAFIGFEDMVNVAEEVKDAPRTLPRAIVVALVATAALYLAVALVAVLAVPPADLAASGAPLALIFERSTGASSAAVSAIAIVAVLNGALIQLIMASRVVYGLAAQGWLPAGLSRIDPRTRTPLVATALVTLVALGFALWLPLVALARLTSLIALAVFALVNLALVRLKRREPAPAGVFRCPAWVPAAGFAVSAACVVYQIAAFAAG